MTRTDGRRLVAALACRNQGSRLYGKPVQNLDVEAGIRIIDNIVACLRTISSIDEVVLGISEGVDNQVFIDVARSLELRYIIGDERDVLSRLIACGRLADATDVFRVTSESPFMLFEAVEDMWTLHCRERADATFLDDVVDGCGFEILSLAALERSHEQGEERHRSELCTLFIREHVDEFRILRPSPPPELVRRDLRLTVDNPEDLVVCRAVYRAFRDSAPRIPVREVVAFLDRNPGLIELTSPYTEAGYSTMYRWGSHV
jgi:spore coat polysaccharide biosynthesis protein SpsF